MDDVASPLGRARTSAQACGMAFLRSYAQVFFSRSWVVGALLLIATSLQPVVALHGAGAVVIALAGGRLLGLRSEALLTGFYAYNALLVGLGLGAFLEPSWATALLLIASALAAVVVMAALHTLLLPPINLPPLTLPFLLVLPVSLGAANLLGISRLPASVDAVRDLLGLPAPLAAGLQSLGALFFLPRVEVGAVLLLALLVSSRISATLAALGLGVAWLVAHGTVGGPEPIMVLSLGFNLALVAIAVGGVWFVPGPASYLLAAAAAALTGVLTLGLIPIMTWLGLPLLVVPFNLTLLMLLVAVRQRRRDLHPKAVDLVPGTPEENLSRYRTRQARLGAQYPVRLRAPFMGRWTCTQGPNGELTHREAWSEAADFQLLGADGSPYRGRGTRRAEHHCYRLPVLASADGTVAEVRDGVPDNEPGQTNLSENWGNVVVLRHSPTLFSLVAHLQPQSLEVQEGQLVRAGDTLGRCGSSGRSPHPHLHFQLQGSPRVGAPTLPLELHDVVVEDEHGAERLEATLVPRQGVGVRALEPDPELERRLSFTHGQRLSFRMFDEHGQPRSVVTVRGEVDLYGDLLLRSESCDATLWYDTRGGVFTVFHAIGPAGSVLHMLHAALARVPLENNPRLSWSARLPLRAFRLPLAGWLLDPILPFLPDGGPEVRYRMEQDGQDLVVLGVSERKDASGTPRVQTRCVLRRGVGPVEVEVTFRGRVWRAERVLEPAERTSASAGASA